MTERTNPKSKSGTPITDDLADQLADEAERGYDLSHPDRQLTRPNKGKPVEIPVPKREDVLRDLAKAAVTPDPDQRN